MAVMPLRLLLLLGASANDTRLSMTLSLAGMPDDGKIVVQFDTAYADAVVVVIVIVIVLLLCLRLCRLRIF